MSLYFVWDGTQARLNNQEWLNALNCKLLNPKIKTADAKYSLIFNGKFLYMFNSGSKYIIGELWETNDDSFFEEVATKIGTTIEEISLEQGIIAKTLLQKLNYDFSNIIHMMVKHDFWENTEQWNGLKASWAEFLEIRRKMDTPIPEPS